MMMMMIESSLDLHRQKQLSLLNIITINFQVSCSNDVVGGEPRVSFPRRNFNYGIQLHGQS